MKSLSRGHVRTALAIMRHNRSRSVLTMLGVIVGVAAVILVIGIGEGVKQQITDQVNRYGKNVVTIRPAIIGGAGSIGSLDSIAGGNVTGTLTQSDANAIGRLPLVSASVPLTLVAGTASADHHFNALVIGASDDLSQVMNQPLQYGVFFSSNDSSNNVAVLGATAADRLFDSSVPLGRSFSLHGQQFVVEGILSPFAPTPFASQTNFNNAIFVPADAANQVIGNAPIYEILAKVPGQQQLPAAAHDITKTLLRTHDGQHDFSVLQPSQVAGQTTHALGFLTELIVAAAALALLVGGIGIMNVMLVTVTERMHEIGIRKAVGATNRQILSQFLIEALTLSVVGSLIGIVLALLGDFILRVSTELTPVIRWNVVLITAAISVVIGVVFGTVPAYKAARKDAITALRNE